MRLIFWIVFTVMAAVFLAMVLWAGPVVKNSAFGSMSFDSRITGYTPEQALEFLRALSEEGRLFYLNVLQRLDTAFPALLTVSLVLGFQKFYGGPMKIIWAAVAVAYCVFDYLENAAIKVMLLAGSDGFNPDMAVVANQWSVLKWGFVIVALCAFFAGVWRFREKNKGA